MAVSELNLIICKYIYNKIGLIIEITSIKEYMEFMYEKPKDNSKFWYKENKDYFYKEVRWKTLEEKTQKNSIPHIV